MDWKKGLTIYVAGKGETASFAKVFGVSDEESDLITSLVNGLIKQGKTTHEIAKEVLEQPWVTIRGWSCFLAVIGAMTGKYGVTIPNTKP